MGLSLDSTYEGLKRRWCQARAAVSDRLDSTYEGLKPESVGRAVFDAMMSLDSTYEGLKLSRKSCR